MKLFEVHNSSVHLQQTRSRILQKRRKSLEAASSECLSSMTSSTEPGSCPFYQKWKSDVINVHPKSALKTMTIMLLLFSLIVQCCSAATSSSNNNNYLYRRPSGSANYNNNNNLYSSRVTRESVPNIIPGFDSVHAAAERERETQFGESNSDPSSSGNRPGISHNTFPPHHQFRHHRHQYSGLNHPNSLQTAPVGG